MSTLRIGTRGSPLALTQTGWVADALRAAHPGLLVELEVIQTRGDKILDVPLAQVGGKGLFVKEIEEALLDGRVDLAVHSLKDVPVELPPGLALGGFPEREDPRDVLLTREGLEPALDALPAGCRVGTSSLRRSSQLLARRPDLRIVSIRGNVGTRIAKMERGEVDAVVLAAAGLRRMDLVPPRLAPLEPDVLLPAIGQGVLALELRDDDAATAARVDALAHEPTRVAVEAERAFLARLDGSCQVPMGAHARAADDELRVEGIVASLDGARVVRRERAGPSAAAAALGRSLAEEILEAGGAAILAELHEGPTA